MSSNYRSRNMSNNDTGDMTTGSRLRALMREKGVSQKALARMSGINASTIRRMCNGDTLGSFHTWAKVLSALEADANDFIRNYIDEED